MSTATEVKPERTASDLIAIVHLFCQCQTLPTAIAPRAMCGFTINGPVNPNHPGGQHCVMCEPLLLDPCPDCGMTVYG